MYYPPARTCQKLHDFSPLLRLAWDGELGKFALVQLFSMRRAAKSYREPWKRRGPIFDKNGKTRQDFSRLSYVPIYIIDVETEDVFSGEVVRLVKRWSRPIAARVHEAALEKGRALESNFKDMAHEMGSELYKKSQAGGYGAPVVARKHVEESLNYKLHKSGMMPTITEGIMPPAPDGGWEKHIKADKGDHDKLGSI
jgi:hypothetical protein